jgi:O-antigen ligase
MIKSSPVLGIGFGIPINYSQSLVDLSRTDPFIKFIPHDGILYVWMRMGVPGALGFWCVVGFGILAGARLARARRGRAAVLGVLVIGALVGYVIEGYYDMGLYWFRMAVFMGVLLGTSEVALRWIDAPAEVEA